MENNSEDIEIDIGRLLSIVWNKIWLIIFIGVFCGVGAFVASKLFIVPKYVSHTKLYVLNRAMDGTTTLTDLQTSTQLTKDYQIMVTSRPVMEEVIKKTGLDCSTQDLAEQIKVSTPSDTRVLQISVINTDPYKAKEIADAVAEASAERICKIMQIEQVNVIEDGSVATKPMSSGLKKNTLIGALVGIVLACAFVIIKSLMDDTIKDSDDIEKYLGLSTLSMIPICDEMDDGRGKTKKGKKNKSKKKNK